MADRASIETDVIRQRRARRALAVALTAAVLATAPRARAGEGEEASESDRSPSSSTATLGILSESVARIPRDPPAEPIKRRLRGEILNWTGVKAEDLYGRSGPSLVQNFVGLNYRIDSNQGVSIRQPFVYNYEWPQTSGTSTDFHVRDAYLEYSNGQLAALWEGAKIALVFARLGFPTGEDSRFVTKTRGWAFAWFQLNQALGKGFFFNWHVRPRYFVQSQDTYVDDKGARVGGREYVFDHWPEIEWRLNSKWSVTTGMGTSHAWLRAGAGVPAKQEFNLSSWSTVNWQATEDLGVTFALSNDADLTGDSSKPFGLYRNEDTSFHLILFATI